MRKSSCRVTVMIEKWKISSSLRLLMIVVLLPLAGCGGKSVTPLSATQQDAIKYNQRGIKAEARGDRESALDNFNESLRINDAIENTDGMVVALVNISRVNRYKEEIDAARRAIDRAIDLITPPSPLFSEVAYEKSKVSLQSKDLTDAREWAAKSLAAEIGSKRGSRLNLLARILYLEGRFVEAGEKAKEALALSRKEKLREEEANSLRLLGGIFTSTKRPGEALEAYNQALALDKALGKSRKIAGDLRGLALLHISLNEPEQTMRLYQRAYAVSLNDGDVESAAGDLLKMAQLYEKMGDKDKAERLLSKRDALLKKLEKH